MSVIITHVDERSQLSVHTIEGAINDDDIITTIEEYNRGEPTLFVIWDFSDADLSGFNEENIQFMLKFGKHYTANQTGGKTALVLPDDMQFGLGRMVEAYAELMGIDRPIRSFRSQAAARRWLGIAESERFVRGV